jgi:heterodisulfide reductase subunit A
MTINRKTGSVLVVGGGIAGMQASLDLAESGFKVYMVESSPAIGGRMAQLDKTFPTNDCAMCTLAPRMVDVGGHINIEKLTYSEVVGIQGEPGHFRVSVKKKARSVDMEKCTGCGECTLKCPVLKAKSPVVLSEYDAGLVRRGSIYIPFPQAVPKVAVIDRDSCPYFQQGRCRACKKVCQAKAINFDQKDEVVDLGGGGGGAGGGL